MRRLVTLLRGLPPESQLQQELAGQPLTEAWTWERELLATLVEVCSVTATERHRLRKPVTVTRPRSAEPPAQRPATVAEAARMTLALRDQARAGAA